MPLDIILLIIRITVAVILYAFLGTVLIYVLRDIKTTSQHIDESQRVSGKLIVIGYKDTATETGQTYPLRRLTTLGRGPTNTIVLEDSFASVYHAQITHRSGQWWIEDQHSHNGTLLNDIPLAEAVVLSSGDIISIGHTKLLVEFD
jgi:hypothetical protein